MTQYLIEFRFHGKAKHKIKALSKSIQSKFGIRVEKIPHISLAGGFSCNDETRLIRDFNHLCQDSPLMRFEIDDFGTFDNSRTAFLHVSPSKELDEFRWKLSQTLQPYCSLKSYDLARKFYFHATIAHHIPDDKFRQFQIIKDYVRKMQKISIKHVVVRVTLIKNTPFQKRGHILREYDVFLRRPLTRFQAKDNNIYVKTMGLLSANFEDKYDPTEYIGDRLRMKKKGIISLIKGIFTKPKVFITSDLHLDHANIIKYCQRPFINVAEMNKTLVSNWNNTIRNKDKVYFLGDLAFGTGSKSTDYWVKQLHGKIIFIKGNHERSEKLKLHERYILDYKGHKFYLTHDPADVPRDWTDWAICGHHHNNDIQKFPFIDKVNKRINVSVELTKFRPVDMDEIILKVI